MQEAVGEAEFLKLVQPHAVVVDEGRIGRDEAHADAAVRHLRGDREARGPGAHDEHVHGRVVRQRLEDVDDGSLVLENLSLLKLDPLAVGSKLGRLLRLVDVPAGDELGEVDARAADGLGGGVCLLVRVRPGDRALARDGGELGLLKNQHRFWVESENRFVSLKVSAKGMRIIDKKGISAVLKDIRARGEKV